MSDFGLGCGFYIKQPSSIIEIIKTTKKMVTYREYYYNIIHVDNDAENIKYVISYQYEDKSKVKGDEYEIYIGTDFSKKYFKSNRRFFYDKLDVDKIIF
tara:strand:+ start:354 stop:650 length:297 start_codon:yes stop_codon:yes gene_type:complete